MIGTKIGTTMRMPMGIYLRALAVPFRQSRMMLNKPLLFCCLILWSHVFVATGHEDHGHLRHWEIASQDPDRIILTFSGDPSTSRAVTWRTSAEVPAAAAEIYPAKSGPLMFRHGQRFPAATEALDLRQRPVNKQGVTHHHSVVFTNLQPDTLYAYRVSGGKGRWSEWFQFKTASTDSKPFQFVYFGDAQNEVFSTWSRVIRRAYQTAPDAVFAVHAGDMVNLCHYDRDWAEWFTAGSFIHSQWTTVPVLGNHEFWGRVMSIQWRPQFTLPVVEELPEPLHETVYTISYQGAQIIVLDSNRLIAEQVDYLESRLQEPGYHWRIVTYHHSAFAPRGQPNLEVIANWVPLFHKYGVDLVLQGHDHSYARGITSANPAAPKDAAGDASSYPVVYVTSISGPKQYRVDRAALSGYKDTYHITTGRVAENTQLYQVIDVSEEELAFKAFTATGELYDALKIIRNAETGEKEIVADPPSTPERAL